MNLLLAVMNGALILIIMYCVITKVRLDNLDAIVSAMKHAIPRRCTCPYSKYCTTPRQHLQCIFREDGHYDSVDECDFYKLIHEENKPKEG